jgi:Zn-dependent protease with chaperone function
MAVSGTLPAAPAPLDRPRPDVLAYPSPTTSRFLIFLAALLTVGMFVGFWVHYQLMFDEWREARDRCRQEALRQTASAQQNGFDRCRAPADLRRAAFAFGGAAAAGSAGLVVLYLAPGVIERRRRLRPIVTGLEPASERVAALASEAGLARPPTLMLGPAAQRDGFSYGSPGRYRIALPRAVAIHWRNASVFDPLVRHELAHIAHRDVALAWLARSIWYALAPLLAAPLIVILLSSDRSILGDYLWRAVLWAALLVVMVQLASKALLRSREHDADLRAARTAGGPEQVTAVLSLIREPGEVPWYRRLLANHPSPVKRLAVLQRPELAVGVTFLDGFTAAFFIPLIVQTSVTPLGYIMGGHYDLARVAAALLGGLLLGGSVGLGLWRATLVQRVSGGRMRPASLALGVAAGVVLGRVASFAQAGPEDVGGITHPLMLAVFGLAGLGITALAAGLGELWADAGPALRNPRTSWMVALAVSSVVFSFIHGATGSLELVAGLGGGWGMAEYWLVWVLGTWPTLGALAVLAGAVGWALSTSRQNAMTPAWLLERGPSLPWPTTDRASLAEAIVPAVAGGLVVAGMIFGFRVLTGPPVFDIVVTRRIDTYIWMVAAASAAMTLALALLIPRRGVAVGALAGPLASLVAVAGLLAMANFVGGSLDADFVTRAIRFPLALGLLLAVLVAPASLLTWHQEPRLARIWPAAAAVSLVTVLLVVGGRDALWDHTSKPLSENEASQYAETAVRVHRRLSAVETVVATITADKTIDGPARAARIRAEVLAPMRELVGDAETYQPPTPNIRSVHLAVVASLQARKAGLEILAGAYETGDAAAFAAAQAKFEEARRHASTWQAGLQKLLATA